MDFNVSLMRRWISLPFLLGAAILLLLLTGCDQTPVPTPWPTRTPTPVEPTATPYKVSSAVSLPELAEIADSSNCIDCHTDEELLKEVAEEPEIVETQSEGEG